MNQSTRPDAKPFLLAPVGVEGSVVVTVDAVSRAKWGAILSTDAEKAGSFSRVAASVGTSGVAL